MPNCIQTVLHLPRLLPALLLSLLLMSFTSDKPAYRLFNAKGKDATYQALLKDAQKADVILFGELHNNPISHWLQLELARDLHQVSKDKLALSAEMLEADNKVILDEYLQGRISESSFEQEARLWNNYKTDYKPLVQFAKKEKLPVIAANVPRRYASMVSKQGLEALQSLGEPARAWLPQLPVEVDYELPQYKAMLSMFGEGHGGGGAAGKQMIQAQALKDATMAHFIHRATTQGRQVLHFTGAYHSDKYEGINWYLKRLNPQLRIVTISTVQQQDLQKLDTDHQGRADFIIVVPENMTKTH